MDAVKPNENANAPLRCYLCGGEVIVTADPQPTTQKDRESVAHFDCLEREANIDPH